jgi:tetratricopeptide (TPR) repeat protein
MRDMKLINEKDGKYSLATNNRELAIPSSIQDVIMARIDSLPEPAKEIIHIGSVIEREFSHELIKQVTRLPEHELLSHLSILKDSELLYERGVYPKSTYIFRHALTQEVAYASILTKAKRKYHEEVAKAIEEIHSDAIEQYYGILAKHYIDSENYEQGAKYSKFASKRAARTGSLNDAINHALTRLSCLEKMPKDDRVRDAIIHLRIILGLFMIDMNDFRRARETITPIVQSVLKGPNEKKMALALSVTGASDFVLEEDYPKAFGQLEWALEISKRTNDLPALAVSSYWLGCGQAFCCKFEEAAVNIGRSEEIQRMRKLVWGESTLKSLLSYLVYYYQGKIPLGSETSRRAFRIAEESGDIFSRTSAHITLGISCFGRRSFQEAVDLLSKGIELSESLDQHGWKMWSNHFLGEVYSEMGQYQKAIDNYHRVVSLFDLHGIWPSTGKLSRIGLARARILNGQKEVDLERLYEDVSTAKARVFEGWMRRYLAEILLRLDEGRLTKAEEWIQGAIAADERNGTLFELGRDFLLLAEISKRKGNGHGVQECLHKAIDIFKNCGADGWVSKCEEEMAKLT